MKIALVVVLLISTALVVYFTKGRGKGDDAVFKEEQAMLCVNPQCKGVFTLTLGEIHQETAKIDAMQSLGPPAFTCQHCNQKTAYMAEKCPFCETVFFPNSQAHDFHDRCPKCGKSETEEKRKRAQP